MTPIHYWVIIQLFIDFFLVVLIWTLLKNMRERLRKDAARETSRHVMAMLEPLLKEADAVSSTFEKQLKEKNRLIHSLNEKLDSRIISLNLLLNRARSNSMTPATDNQKNVYDQQESIIALYQKGDDARTIADKLSMPRGEVDLVLDLKTRFEGKEQLMAVGRDDAQA